MRFFLIDLAHRLRIPACDGCGRWVKGWRWTTPFAVPVCPTCMGRLLARIEARDRVEE